MQFSRTLKSSVQSLPSPDGTYIATVFPSKLSIRETRSLEVTRVLNLPAELSSSISWFLWSASSSRILVASTTEIRVFSPLSSQVLATISNPTSGKTRPVHVAFGATDNEVCVFSEFGLKLSIFNLTTGKSVDINNPKFFNPGVASKGLSYRPESLNLALLTRSGGKDIISIHAQDNLDVTRSWHPDTIDAQGLCWSPDGRWLAIWESASQGHLFLIYAADGYLYKSWNGPVPVSGDTDLGLGPGIKAFEWSRSGSHVAIGDYSSRVTVLSVPLFTVSMNLLHTTSIKPTDGLQVWQELATPRQGGVLREFVQAQQIISPPTSTVAASNDSNTKSGTNILTFDNSGTLLATRVENMPSTIWIWDIRTKTLRAVLVLHAPIAKLTWHPSVDEILLIRCEGPDNRALVHLWDPSWENPQIIDFAVQLPGGKIIGKTVGRWLNTKSSNPTVFFSDSQDCILTCLPGPGDSTVPWHEAEARGMDIYGQREESPLNLVAADAKRSNSRFNDTIGDDTNNGRSGGSDEYVEDTFYFRK